MKNKLIIALVAVIGIFMTACTAKKEEPSRTGKGTYADYVDTGKRIAVQAGDVYGDVARDVLKAKETPEYTAVADMLASLRRGNVDAVLLSGSYVKQLEESGDYPDVDYLMVPADVYVNKAAAIFHTTQLRDKYNEWFSGIAEDGTWGKIVDRWLGGALPAQEDIPQFELTGENGTLKMCSTGNFPPLIYFDSHGKLAGFDVDMMSRFAQHMKMDLKIELMNYDAIIPYVILGKADMSACTVTVTDERGEGVIFGEPSVITPAVLIVPKTGGAPQMFRAEDWVGKRISTVTGGIYDQIVHEDVPGAEPVYFNNSVDAIEALKNGMIDGIMQNSASIRKHAARTPGLRMLEPFVTNEDYGVIVSQKEPDLLNSLNRFIAQMKSDGTYEDMLTRWLDTIEPPPIPAVADGTGGTLRFGTTSVVDGFSYYKDGKITGFDIEFAKRFASFIDMKIDISVMDHSGLIIAAQTGKIDFAASLFTINEERGKSVNFTDVYYTGGAAIAVYDPSSASAEHTVNQGFWERIKTGFERNLIRENRWKMIAGGLRVSLIITVLSFALATVLGFGVCALNMSKNPVLRTIGDGYITILRGTPIVVLLMIAFYVIFAKSSISGVTVAIIAFGFNSAAFIGEILHTSILTVDKGQIEAARSMGFSKAGAFFTVTFPQAVRVAFPVYMSEFTDLFKMTSVVGYIAIVDLTKAGDIIRSRTYDAFFPLIMVALVYLIVASIMIWLFDLIKNKTNKRLRRAK